MTAKNRDVSDIPRDELEGLVMELKQEIYVRSKKVTELTASVTTNRTRIRATEASLQDQNLEYIVPPSALRPNVAFNYAKSGNVDDLDPDMEATREDGTTAPKPKYDSHIAGSYNPYQGANRRIVTLRQKIGDLQQEIIDTHKDMQDQIQERERLRALLENRETPNAQPFRHDKPIPKYKNKNKKDKITLKQCVEYCEDLLKNEKDPESHDELLCVYYLLTRNDAMALQLFEKLFNPDSKPEDLAVLDDILKDREAQISILTEQYRHLYGRHEPLRDAFRDLKDRLPDHLVNNTDVIEHLREQIAALSKKIEGIPDIESEIEKLRAQRDTLINEKEEILKEGSVSAAELDAEIRKKLNGISGNKAGVEQEKRQLEELDKRIREQYNTIAIEAKQMKDDEARLRALLNANEEKKKIMHSQLTMLQKAGLKTPKQVREVFTNCTGILPDDLTHDKYDLLDQCNKSARRLKDLKKECVRLKTIYSDKQRQQVAYEDRIERGKYALAGRNNDAAEF